MLPIIPIHSDPIPNASCPTFALFSLNLNLLLTHAKEIPMKVITIGKRLVPAAQIAFVEPFDPSSNPEFKPEKDYKARVVLLNREMVLTEQTPQEFASAHDLHLLAEDGVAINRAVSFKVETFEPTENFKPSRDYKTRLKWRDLADNEQSKLLVTAPETVIAEILNRELELPVTAKRPARRQARGRSGSRRMEAFRI
jgi:hypothetical protein